MLQTLINNSCLVTISDIEWTKTVYDLKVFPLDMYTDPRGTARPWLQGPMVVYCNSTSAGVWAGLLFTKSWSIHGHECQLHTMTEDIHNPLTFKMMYISDVFLLIAKYNCAKIRHVPRSKKQKKLFWFRFLKWITTVTSWRCRASIPVYFSWSLIMISHDAFTG